MSAEDRAIAALLGLAAGDAVGTTLEFKSPGWFRPIDDMVGGGPFNLPAGAWTADTSMALCMAESILDTGELDLVDQHAPLRPVARPRVPVVDWDMLRHGWGDIEPARALQAYGEAH